MTRTFFFLNLEFYFFVATATLRTSFTSRVGDTAIDATEFWKI